jgi:hypothetical protein
MRLVLLLPRGTHDHRSVDDLHKLLAEYASSDRSSGTFVHPVPRRRDQEQQDEHEPLDDATPDRVLRECQFKGIKGPTKIHVI